MSPLSRHSKPDGASPPGTARDVALAALSDRAGNVTAHLNRLLAQAHLAPQEAALARELALGVVRRQRTLDAVLAAFQRHGSPYPARIRSILRLGAYQLLFLQRVPDFAAVNEAVKQVGAGAGLRGFVNALLRNIARSASEAQPGPVEPARDVLPLEAGAFRRFDRPMFPNPATAPAGYLALAYSLPDELAEKWLGDLGGLDAAARIAAHANARPPLVLRVNSLRATVPQVLQRLADASIEAVAHRNGLSVVVTGRADPSRLEVFTEGLVQPQDAAATSVVAACPVKPGMRVLDLCAAPGTKTTHLAERMGDRGEILAVDVSDEKLTRIQESCRRMGLSIIRTALAPEIAAQAETPFKLVLVDAPCSNTGVLARRPEARWRFSRDNLSALVNDQRHLLLLGAQLVAPGGVCVYSTCSLENQENQQVVQYVLSRRSDLELRTERVISPAGADNPAEWSDGGYFALLRRV